MSECKLTSQNSENIAARLRSLFDGKKQSEVIAIFGWDKSLLSRIWAGKQCPNAEYLADLATVERVNLTWLLTGEGPPYLVLPPPKQQDIAIGPYVEYYLFDRPDGVQPPLVCVRRAPPNGEPHSPPRVTVHHGDLGDLMRAVEWLVWKRQIIHVVEDNDGVAAQLRAGHAGNRALFDDGSGILERTTLILPMPRLPPSALIEETPNGYATGARSTLDDREREWVMRWRELPEPQREALLLILRALTAGE